MKYEIRGNILYRAFILNEKGNLGWIYIKSREEAIKAAIYSIMLRVRNEV